MGIKKNNLSKISIITLLFVSLFFGSKYYKTTTDFNRYKENSILENKLLTIQLTEILHQYDSLSVKNKLDSIRFNEVFKSTNSHINSANHNIKSHSNAADSVLLNSKKAYKFPQLAATNIYAKGIKIYSDLYAPTNSQIQQLRVCYTLQNHATLKSGTKKVYIQVVNPKNQIISKNNLFVENLSGTKLQFSAFSEVNFYQKDTDVCADVDLEKNKTIKGKYLINIYSDFIKIGATVFEYK